MLIKSSKEIPAKTQAVDCELSFNICLLSLCPLDLDTKNVIDIG